MLLTPGGDNMKAVYVSPTKALCHERCQDWKQKFRGLGVTCNELTGDSDLNAMRDVQQSTIM